MKTSYSRELKISYQKDSRQKYNSLPQVTCSRMSAEVLRNLWGEDISHYESFFILCLSRANKVIGHYKVSQGGISGTVVDAKIIFSVALNVVGCSSLILAHNHPSGNLLPSRADIALTKKLVTAGNTLDITVLDHIVLTESGYISFADDGYME